MAESIEQFLKPCGRYRRVEDIPEAEKAAMLKRIRVDEIERARISARDYQRFQAEKRARAKHKQP